MCLSNTKNIFEIGYNTIRKSENVRKLEYFQMPLNNVVIVIVIVSGWSSALSSFSKHSWKRNHFSIRQYASGKSLCVLPQTPNCINISLSCLVVSQSHLLLKSETGKWKQLNHEPILSAAAAWMLDVCFILCRYVDLCVWANKSKIIDNKLFNFTYFISNAVWHSSAVGRALLSYCTLFLTD